MRKEKRIEGDTLFEGTFLSTEVLSLKGTLKCRHGRTSDDLFTDDPFGDRSLSS